MLYGRVAVREGDVSATLGGVPSVSNGNVSSIRCPTMSHAVARRVWLPSGTADASTQIPRACGVHGSWGTTWPSISVVRDVQFRPVTLSKFTQIGWGVRRGGALGWTRPGAPRPAPPPQPTVAPPSQIPRRDPPPPPPPHPTLPRQRAHPPGPSPPPRPPATPPL